MINFDKTYIISYVHNVNKRDRMAKKMKELDIDNYDFIYGCDLNNLSNFIDVSYKGTDNDNRNEYYVHAISCALTHLTAIQLGYDLGANSILIMEDDILFYKDINFIKKCLNDYPQDADLIQFGYFDVYNRNFNQTFNKTFYTCGAQMYALCNRNIMNDYIKSQYNIFCSADNIDVLVSENNYNIYLVNPQLCIDPYHHDFLIETGVYSNYN
jgi:GR25 family glycosyltransferase involved in LPS biosynthesis